MLCLTAHLRGGLTSLALLIALFTLGAVHPPCSWAQGAFLFAPPPQEQEAGTNGAPKATNEAPKPSDNGAGEALNQTHGVVVNESGHKTIVIRGDDAPPASQVTIDGGGHKTIVIRGDDSPPSQELTQGAGTPKTLIPSETPYWLQTDKAVEKPYWHFDQPKAERPYFWADETPEPAPYWRKVMDAEPAPYWQVKAESPESPYWELPKAEVPQEDKGQEPQSEIISAKTDDKKTISYYMYVDEKGITHLANAPTDPRYQEVTITVEIKLARGQGRLGSRFTHERLREHIMEAAISHNLDPALIAAVIKSESAFDAQAVSWAGAQGLMQLMPGTAREVGCRNPFDPRDNIMGGSR
ncbi:MAG: lytic transglycosylase domain-containing protein, partial [Candidatus Adiutrix sp.]